jgi:hypothetical protein
MRNVCQTGFAGQEHHQAGTGPVVEAGREKVVHGEALLGTVATVAGKLKIRTSYVSAVEKTVRPNHPSVVVGEVIDQYGPIVGVGSG